MPIYYLGILHYCTNCNEEFQEIDDTIKHLSSYPNHIIIVKLSEGV